MTSAESSQLRREPLTPELALVDGLAARPAATELIRASVRAHAVRRRPFAVRSPRGRRSVSASRLGAPSIGTERRGSVAPRPPRSPGRGRAMPSNPVVLSAPCPWLAARRAVNRAISARSDRLDRRGAERTGDHLTVSRLPRPPRLPPPRQPEPRRAADDVPAGGGRHPGGSAIGGIEWCAARPCSDGTTPGATEPELAKSSPSGKLAAPTRQTRRRSCQTSRQGRRPTRTRPGRVRSVFVCVASIRMRTVRARGEGRFRGTTRRERSSAQVAVRIAAVLSRAYRWTTPSVRVVDLVSGRTLQPWEASWSVRSVACRRNCIHDRPRSRIYTRRMADDRVRGRSRSRRGRGSAPTRHRRDEVRRHLGRPTRRS